MFHTAEAFATGMRDLRSRLPDTWMAGGTEWVSLPLLHIRCAAFCVCAAGNVPVLHAGCGCVGASPGTHQDATCVRTCSHHPCLPRRYGEWPRLLAMPPPPKDARGVTSLGGRQFAAVVYHAGRTLALAARAQAAAAALLGVDDRTAFELASKSL